VLAGPARSRPVWLWAILALIAAGIALQYTLLIGRPLVELAMRAHGEIIDGTAPSPYRYRVLVPFTMDALLRVLPGIPARLAFLGAYAGYAAAAVAFSLIALHAWARRWSRPWPALAAILLVAAIWPVAMRNHFFQPWSLIEPGLVALGLLWILDRRDAALVPLVALATLNRETGIYLGALYLAIRWNERPWARTLLLVAVWAFVFFGLRLVRGEAPHPFSPEFHWRGNLAPGGLARAATNLPLLLGPLVPPAVLGYHLAPAPLRRALLVVIPQVVAAWIFAYWFEVRLLLPAVTIALPLVALGLERLVEGRPRAAGAGPPAAPL
jgi:hypothetical protein